MTHRQDRQFVELECGCCQVRYGTVHTRVRPCEEHRESFERFGGMRVHVRQMRKMLRAKEQGF